MQNLTLKDFRVDPLIVRKIKRIQEAEAAAAQESSDEEEQVPRARKSVPAPKLEVPSTQQPHQSSIIEDLGDPSEDESQQPPASSMVMDLGDPSESEAEL